MRKSAHPDFGMRLSMGKAAIVLCCLALLAASCGQDESASELAEKSAQKLNVGMTQDEVRAVLGDPDVIGSPEYWWYLYGGPSIFGGETHMAFLEVFFQDGKVVDWSNP